METIIFIMSICSFILGILFLRAQLIGKDVSIFILRTISALGIITPIIYWLKLFQII